MFRVFQQGQDVHLRAFFQSTVVQGMHGELLEALDDVVNEIQSERSLTDRWETQGGTVWANGVCVYSALQCFL